jgi:hypothetical protein
VMLILLSPFVLQSFVRRRKPTLGEWILRELDKKAEARKLHRDPAETMRAFVARWQHTEPTPEAREALKQLSTLYEMTEYAPTSGAHETKRKAIKKWLAKI